MVVCFVNKKSTLTAIVRTFSLPKIKLIHASNVGLKYNYPFALHKCNTRPCNLSGCLDI